MVTGTFKAEVWEDGDVAPQAELAL